MRDARRGLGSAQLELHVAGGRSFSHKDIASITGIQIHVWHSKWGAGPHRIEWLRLVLPEVVSELCSEKFGTSPKRYGSSLVFAVQPEAVAASDPNK